MRRFFSVLWKVVLGLFVASIFLVVITKYVPIAYTPLMLKRSIEYANADATYSLEKKWVPLEKINPRMVMAVIISEDAKYMDHNGFDWDAIERARANNAKGKKIKGGSTISQQTAKNVFTFCSRTYFRKGIEAYFTFLIEQIWGKERIVEVYLNVVELGNHIYGVEAASQHYYHHSAATLNKQEAARLAAVLPNPRRYSVTNPGPFIKRKTNAIIQIMNQTRQVKF